MSELEWTGERLLPERKEEYFVFEHLHRYAIAIQLCKNKKVLDIACGEGYGSDLLSSVAVQVTGVDIDRAAVNHAIKKYQANKTNLQFLQGSTSKIPLENDSIDVVVSFETIEHHNEHEQMLKEIKRVLKKDGMLIISSPNKDIYRINTPNNKHHIKELTFEEFELLLKNNFNYLNFYEQRYIVGSLITSMSNAKESFDMYEGNFTEINKFLTGTGYLNYSNYILAICSNNELADNSKANSFFSGIQPVIAAMNHLKMQIKKKEKKERYLQKHRIKAAIKLLLGKEI
jgi:ubiquinone/menaquinone biosynthesis C-methylase UbiE